MYYTACLSAFLVFVYYDGVLTAWMTAIEPPAPIRVEN
jgi:hypothetical protein